MDERKRKDSIGIRIHRIFEDSNRKFDESTVDRRSKIEEYTRITYAQGRFSISIRIFNDSNSTKFHFERNLMKDSTVDRRFRLYIRTSKKDSPSLSEYSRIQIARNLMDERVHNSSKISNIHTHK